MIITLMKKKFVGEYHWIDERKMLNLVAITRSSPGVIAVNGTIVMDYKLAGMAGVLTPVLAAVIPPFVVLSAISLFYAAFRSNSMVDQMLGGTQAGVGTVITQIVWKMGSGIARNRQRISVCIMTAAFIANHVLNANVILVILIYTPIGVARTLRAGKTREEGGRTL